MHDHLFSGTIFWLSQRNWNDSIEPVHCAFPPPDNVNKSMMTLLQGAIFSLCLKTVLIYLAWTVFLAHVKNLNIFLNDNINVKPA